MHLLRSFSVTVKVIFCPFRDLLEEAIDPNQYHKQKLNLINLFFDLFSNITFLIYPDLGQVLASQQPLNPQLFASQPLPSQPATFQPSQLGAPINQSPLAVAPGFIPLDNTVTPGAQPPSPGPESAVLPSKFAGASSPPLNSAVTPQQPQTPVLQPAQFALSSNNIQHSIALNSVPAAVTGKTAPSLVASGSRDVNLGCAVGNDLGFCAVSDRYPR